MSQISEQKTLILTGASRGIGHATVKRFSSAGWRVITCSRQAFSEDCPWDAGPEDHIQIDLADPEDRDRGIAEMRDRLEGAVVAIGNAPTALFHLLERLDDGWPRPAAIIGFPVGFVGAAESKAALAADPRGCDFIALRGRRGGSAMAAGVVNALAAGLGEATR